MNQPWLSKAMVEHGTRLLNSYHRWTGKDLVEAKPNPEEAVKLLFEAPFIVVSHDNEKDPILNYGNRAALELWEMTWDSFIHTPSRLTAEIINRGERAIFLKEVGEKGFSDHYRGIRISSTGRRFRVENALVWNIVDEKDHYLGQAATFNHWEYL